MSPPFYLRDREEPYRPYLALWLEAPSGFVVGQTVVAPEDVGGAVGKALLAALERPLVGPRRRPDTIRVADPALAAEVRAAVGGGIPVTVAPTPELDELLEAMSEAMLGAGDGDSYLDGGRIPAEVVADLFAGAEALYRIAPWKVATDDQVLRMDIPALGVEGACVSIIGHLGESLGVIVFPSRLGYEAFVRAAEAHSRQGGRLDFATDWIALDFERGADLPASMRQEVLAHGWPVATADAYPQLLHHDRDGAARPLTERDLKVATACATAVGDFFTRHRSSFEVDKPEPVREAYRARHDVEVRLTLPYEAFPQFDVVPAPTRQPAPVAQGAPSPVGRDEAQHPTGGGPDASHELDNRLVRELSAFAMARFGSAWLRFAEDFVDPGQAAQLSLPWSVYHYRVHRTTVLERFLEEQGERVGSPEREWLGAQRAAWLSVWEVSQVEPGESVTLHDLLTDATRCVREVSASKTLKVRDAILGRVVEHAGISLLCGVHPRPLLPRAAAEVVRRAQTRLRRKRAIPVERLRDEALGRYLIRQWEDVLAEIDAALGSLPRLQNTDGDPLIPTTDHFAIAPGAQPAVEARLAAMEGAVPPEPGDDPPVYAFLRAGNAMHRSWENTLIGRAEVSDTALRLETNSRERADALRARVEAECGEWVRHRAREHADPLSRKAPSREPAPPGPVPPEAVQLMRELKERHYADWPDQPIPALGGETPREAVRTAGGRAAVDVLLKEMESQERREGGEAMFDFSVLRRALRLE